MLDMNAFNKIFEAPARHNQTTEAGTYDPPVSDRMKREVYLSIDKLGVATTKDIVNVVPFKKSSVRRCINKLLAEGKVTENETKINGRSRVTDYKIKGLR